MLLVFIPAKLLKLGSIIPDFSWFLFTQLVLADLLFVVSIGLLLWGISRASNQQLARLLRLTISLLLFPAVALAIIEHKYFLSTGSLLDARVLAYGIAESTSLFGAFRAEANPGWWLALAASVPLGIGFAVFTWRSDPTAQLNPALGMLVILLSAAFLSNSTDTTNPTDVRLCGIEKNMILKFANEISNDAGDEYQYAHVAPSSRAPISLATTPATNFSNVVIVILESVRADATTPYNPALDTTPFLDNLTENALMVEQGYVVIPHTTTSLISILCGYPPDTRFTLSQRIHRPLPPFCLPRLLKPLGYTSAFFQSARKHFENRAALVADIGFDHFTSHEDLATHQWQQTNYFGVEERAMLSPMMDWVDNQDSPFLLGVLTLMSHHNYAVPDTFPKTRYPGTKLWSDYLNTVRYQDAFLKELLAAFARRELLDSTLFIFVGDHGQGFKEHGLASPDLPYDEGAHIPILFYNKALIPEPVSITGFRNQLDIAPTLVELLGLAIDTGRFWGDSLMQNVADRPVFMSCWKPGYCASRMDKSGKFIYFHTPEVGQLFNLDADPLETNNLISTIDPEQQTRWITEMAHWANSVSGYHRQYQGDLEAE